jgi:hypoxanthine phosphoribosyltransferase
MSFPPSNKGKKMYKKNNKIYFEYDDFEAAVEDVASLIEKENKKVHLVAPYRGGLPLGVRLSNQCNIPLSILDYQRLDGNKENSKNVSMMKNAGICVSDVIYLIDDIADEGITITKSLEYLREKFPLVSIKVYTIFGNDEKHNPDWKYTCKHFGDWIVFVPFEGK